MEEKVLGAIQTEIIAPIQRMVKGKLPRVVKWRCLNQCRGGAELCDPCMRLSEDESMRSKELRVNVLKDYRLNIFARALPSYVKCQFHPHTLVLCDQPRRDEEPHCNVGVLIGTQEECTWGRAWICSSQWCNFSMCETCLQKFYWDWNENMENTTEKKG